MKNKKIIIGISGLIIVAVIAGVFIYRSNKRSSYEDAINEFCLAIEGYDAKIKDLMAPGGLNETLTDLFPKFIKIYDVTLGANPKNVKYTITDEYKEGSDELKAYVEANKEKFEDFDITYDDIVRANVNITAEGKEQGLNVKMALIKKGGNWYILTYM